MSAAKTLIAVLAGGLALLVLPPAALANVSIAVDTPGDGPSGCTLRNAIESADTDSSVGTCPAGAGNNDVVFIPAAIPSPITLNSELVAGGPDSLIITGTTVNQTVSGPVQGRVLRVVGAVHVIGLTLANGFVNSPGPTNTGGGVQVDPSGSLTLDHATVTGSEVDALGDGGTVTALGGGIFAAGALTLIDSTVESNNAVALNTGVSAGDIASGAGGGVFATGASPVEIVNSTITGNTASGEAGPGTGGSFAVGGGIHIGSSGANQARILTSTVSENAVQTIGTPGAPSNGGGIFSVAGLETILTSDTITDNSAVDGANLSGNNIFLANTLLSVPTGGGGNCNAAQTSSGFNLEGGNTCGLTQPTDQINVGSTGLDPNLASNGGPTKTHALSNTSPAIDAGSSFGMTIDQRELARPVDFFGISSPLGGDGTDIGAFEIQKACPAQFVPGGPCAPGMQTTPNSLGFGVLIVGSGSAPQSITVTNPGTTDLSLGAVSLGGADPGDFVKSSDGCSSRMIGPGASCSIEIEFQPTAEGPKTASVIVTGNAPGHPTDTVFLSGTGLIAGSQTPPAETPPAETPPAETPPAETPGQKTGKRAAARKKCRKKFPTGSEKRKNCLKNANKKPA